MKLAVKNNVFTKSCEQITDLKEYHQQQKIKIIPLKKHSKIPQGKDYYTTEYKPEKITKHNGNLGICVGYNHTEQGQSIAVIDIDGYKTKTEDPQYDEYIKNTTAKDIYEILKEIPNCLIVQTQSGGKHIYCWNRTITNNIHEISKALKFPHDYHIEELRDKSLKQSIEIFTKYSSKQCVLPASTIKNKDSNELKHYTVISTINKLSDVCVVDDIHETVKTFMTEKGYSYDPNTVDEDFKTKKETKLRTLTCEEVNSLVSVLVEPFKTVEGNRNSCFLYLGGYLFNKVTQESCSLICDGINKVLNYDEYEHYKNSCMSNYSREGYKKGLPSLLGVFHSCNEDWTIDTVDSLRWKIEKIVNPNFKHKLLQRKFSDNRRKYLSIDYLNKEISTFTENITEDKVTGEEISYLTDIYPIYNFAPLSFYESYNILEENEIPKVCFRFNRKGMPYPQTIKAEDMNSIEVQLKKRPGLVLKPRESQGVLNEIIREYIRLGLLETSVEVPVEGIFINPRTGALVRSGKDGEIPITKPTEEAIKQALLVWDTLYYNYNGDKTKLSHIIRYGLKAPFSFIWKTKYEFFEALFLFGASQTAKTTLAEISMCPWTTIDDTISVGGSSVDTVYRIGKALSRQGLGLIINEPSSTIETDTAIFDLIKRAVETQYCREKMDNGVHVKIPAYSNMIFTSNNFRPSQDAFVRRTQLIEFTKSERFSDDDKKLFRERFNHKNWNSTDFLKLRAIGDYMCWYVSEHMEILGCNKDEFLDKILDSLFEYVGVEPMQWLYENTELVGFEDADENVLQKFRSLVLSDYNRLVNSIIRNDLCSVDELHPPNTEELQESLTRKTNSYEEQFRQYFVSLVNHNQIPYLFSYTNKFGEIMIGVRADISDALQEYAGLQISCKGLADYFELEYKPIKYRGKTIRGFSMSYDNFREILK